MEILRLKEVLLEKGVAGKELAERVSVSAVTISTITSGNSFPKPDLLKKIAEELNVDIRELFHPTKDTGSEYIYIEQDGKYIKIGELKLDQLK